eukprot:TRINITY_DN105128_c0_g1_i1.p1 TRINITY_DN105128_c0_g1~~TRINITY_DN105128_c0_g1_i1.p1  ORF type:complete len:617 (+),score=120.30 TRINITY_DN105128_c0_g1_i1:52-1902(+)
MAAEIEVEEVSESKLGSLPPIDDCLEHLVPKEWDVAAVPADGVAEQPLASHIPQLSAHLSRDAEAVLQQVPLTKEQFESVSDGWVLKLDMVLQKRNEDLVQSIESMLKVPPDASPRSWEFEDEEEDKDVANSEVSSEGKPEGKPEGLLERGIEPAEQEIHTNGRYSLSSQSTAQEVLDRTSWRKIGRFQSSVAKKSVLSEKIVEKTLRQKVADIYASMAVQSFFSVAIISNCALIGVQVQYTAISKDEDDGNALPFVVLSQIYAAVFLIELLLLMFVEGRKFFWPGDCGRACWNFLDIAIVVSSLLEVAIFFVRTFGDPEEESVQGSTLRVVRILRVVRLIRVVRLVRLVRIISSLRRLIESIISTMSALAWSFVLLFMIMYMFGIIFSDIVTSVSADSYMTLSEETTRVLEKDFKDLHTSMLTLLLIITNGTDWGVQFHALYEIHWFVAYTLLIYVAFSVFAVLNVMTGTFCQFAIDSANRDQDLMVHSMMVTQQRQKELIRRLWNTMKTIGEDGEISLYDFEARFQEPEVVSFFQCLEIDMSDAWSLFKLMTPKRNGTLNVDEFVEGCLRLKGTAKKIDVAVMMQEQKRIKRRLEGISKNIELLGEVAVRKMSQ